MAKHFDLIIIGGGPAGLMAAGRAAERGASVLLLEKNDRVGVKLLMTGGGRCNFTNNLPPRPMAESYGRNGRWFLSALTRFSPEKTIAFFQDLGVKTKIEDKGRVFPKSDSAAELLSALTDYVRERGVTIRTGAAVSKIEDDGRRVTAIVMADGTRLSAANYLIATGGRSYPSSGSTGDAYDWLRGLGHRVVKPRAGLSPILLVDDVAALSGIGIDAGLSLYQGEKKLGEERGDILFTHYGLSGPAALSLSRTIARHPGTEMEVRVDFRPDENMEVLGEKLNRLIEDNPALDIKNIVARLIPKKIAEHISPPGKGHGFSKVERQRLLSLLKGYGLRIKGLRGFDEAMITIGGVDLREVDPKTMRSLRFSNLYFAGEVLDLEGPTGGYNLQIAWSSGFVASENIPFPN